MKPNVLYTRILLGFTFLIMGVFLLYSFTLFKELIYLYLGFAFLFIGVYLKFAIPFYTKEERRKYMEFYLRRILLRRSMIGAFIVYMIVMAIVYYNKENLIFAPEIVMLIFAFIMLFTAFFDIFIKKEHGK